MRNAAHVQNSSQCTNSGKIRCFSLLIVLAALAVSHLLWADTPPQELLGRWRSTQTSKGGLGVMLFFRPDGTLDFSPGAVVEMPYRLESNEIVFPAATTGGPEIRMKLKFTGQDQLKLMGGYGEELARKGAAPDPKLPLLGEWEGKRDMGGHQVGVHYLFYSNGRCLLLIPFLKKELKYTIDGPNMRMEQTNQKSASGRFEIKGDVLSIVRPSGEKDDYTRY